MENADDQNRRRVKVLEASAVNRKALLTLGPGRVLRPQFLEYGFAIVDFAAMR